MQQHFAWIRLRALPWPGAGIWLALACAMLACGCPAQNDSDATRDASAAVAGDAAAAASSSVTTASDPHTAATQDARSPLTPAEAIPAGEPLAEYAGLHLGMSSVELAQAYPAPDGRGDGFTRIIQDFGDVQHHIIAFTVKAGEPERRIVASLYRDQLYLIIDRRDGINAAQLKAWHDECLKNYGADCRETIAGAQWTWPGQGGVSLAFTQDNSAPDYMDAHVIVLHSPTQAAAHAYLELREQHEQDAAHPEGSTPR